MTDMKFTESHEWLRTEAGSVVTVGITAHAQEALGDLVFVQLPAIGEKFKQGDDVCVVESVKAAAEVKMPVSGTVFAVNEAIVDDPSLVNTSPLDRGWFIKITPENAADLQGLLDEVAYKKLIGE